MQDEDRISLENNPLCGEERAELSKQFWEGYRSITSRRDVREMLRVCHE